VRNKIKTKQEKEKRVLEKRVKSHTQNRLSREHCMTMTKQMKEKQQQQHTERSSLRNRPK
jgi:hypothetical protein